MPILNPEILLETYARNFPSLEMVHNIRTVSFAENIFEIIPDTRRSNITKKIKETIRFSITGCGSETCERFGSLKFDERLMTEVFGDFFTGLNLIWSTYPFFMIFSTKASPKWEWIENHNITIGRWLFWFYLLFYWACSVHIH